jgi:hypothetical protein
MSHEKRQVYRNARFNKVQLPERRRAHHSTISSNNFFGGRIFNLKFQQKACVVLPPKQLISNWLLRR